ncbi:MAG: EcsC family protein [Bacteroidetes bacterium]|jgi:uncharacterized protein (DUF697 family)|nr:EcsC family protein [Bacteroidota bacterium]
MSKTLDANLQPSMMVKVLHQLYDKALTGGGPFPSVHDVADGYRAMPGSLDAQVRRYLRLQTAKASSVGFITNCGGVVTLPVALPANIAGTLMLQLRTVATVADMYGHDVHHDAVRTLCFLCLCGSGAKDAAKKAGVVMGNKLAMAAVKRVPGRVLIKINKQVGFRLVTKLGHTGVVNLGKLVPLAGGFIGGAMDGGTTYMVGRVACNTFAADHATAAV